MSFFRGDRTFSPFLRHDPFTPFFPRSSFQAPLPLSRVFDSSPFYSPFSPFITVYEEPRHSRYEGKDQSLSSPQKAVEASPSHSNSTSQSTPSQSQSKESKEITSSAQSNGSGVERRQQSGRRPHSGGRPQQQMSLWSPFTGSPFHSSFINSAFAPMAPFSQAMQALPEISLDMFSTPQSYSIHASVPGMDKKDIQVTVEDGVLTIQAERKESRRAANKQSTSSPSSKANPAGNDSTPQSNSESQQSSAEMKYPTEEKEEKTAPPTATQSSSSSAASNSAETTKESVSSGSDAKTADSSSTMEVENGDDDDVNFHHVESFYGRVERSVQLPEDAKVDDLTAHYENGILKIDIPRVEQKTKGRKIEIQ